MKKNTAAFWAICLIASLTLASCGSPSTPSPAMPTAIVGGAGPSPTSTNPPATEPPMPGVGGCANPLFPVVAGATWSYVLSGGPSGPVSYASKVQSVDGEGFELVQAFTGVTVTQRWACAELGLVALDFGGPSASMVTDGSQASFTTVSQTGVTLPNNVEPGESWAQSFQVEGTQTLPGGMTGNSKGKASYQSTAIGFEDVTVAAGTFHAMRIDGKMSLDLTVDMMGVTAPVTLSTDVTSWYAPDVGLVKMTQSGEMMGVAINVDNDLASYSLP